MKNFFPVTFHARFFLVISLLLLSQTNASADELITATQPMQENGGVILQLAVSEPPPASIIVSLSLLPPVEILNASPAAKKYNAEKNKAKWLLKDLKPGSYAIHYQLSMPVSPAQVDCAVQYRDPRNGEMISKKVPLAR